MRLQRLAVCGWLGGGRLSCWVSASSHLQGTGCRVQGLSCWVSASSHLQKRTSIDPGRGLGTWACAVRMQQHAGRRRGHLHKWLHVYVCTPPHARACPCACHVRVHTMSVRMPCPCACHVRVHAMSVCIPCPCACHVHVHAMPVCMPYPCACHVRVHAMSVCMPCPCACHVRAHAMPVRMHTYARSL